MNKQYCDIQTNKHTHYTGDPTPSSQSYTYTQIKIQKIMHLYVLHILQVVCALCIFLFIAISPSIFLFLPRSLAFFNLNLSFIFSSPLFLRGAVKKTYILSGHVR